MASSLIADRLIRAYSRELSEGNAQIVGRVERLNRAIVIWWGSDKRQFVCAATSREMEFGGD